jgi:hypothetical protein
MISQSHRTRLCRSGRNTTSCSLEGQGDDIAVYEEPSVPDGPNSRDLFAVDDDTIDIRTTQVTQRETRGSHSGKTEIKSSGVEGRGHCKTDDLNKESS